MTRHAVLAAVPQSHDPVVMKAREILRTMDRRRELFEDNAMLFADPAWCLLLDLLASGATEAGLPVSSCGIASRVPMSTALRYISSLVHRGYVARCPNPHDRRSALLSLTEKGERLTREALA